MWILPKQLHTSAFVPDTEALISDLVKQSQICGQSLFLRSKPSPQRTWSLKWNRDSWTALLSGRILKPSLGMDFLARWTSSLEGFPANHLVVPESAMETKTHATSFPTFWTALEDADLPLFSSKMLKESSPQNCQETIGEIQPERQFCSMSLGSWNDWVTKQRQAYLARVKLAHLTRGSGSLSWPTPEAFVQRVPIKTELTQTGFVSYHGDQKYGAKLSDAVTCGPADPANLSTSGSRQESWSKRAEFQKQKGINLHLPLSSQSIHVERSQGKLNPRWVETLMGLPVGWVMPSCVNPITPQGDSIPRHGIGNWMTPDCSDRRAMNSKQQRLSNQVNWMTPEAQNSTGYQVSNGKKILRLGSQVLETSTSPVRIAPTNSDSSATELFQQPLNSPSELSGQNLTKPINE